MLRRLLRRGTGRAASWCAVVWCWSRTRRLMARPMVRPMDAPSWSWTRRLDAPRRHGAPSHAASCCWTRTRRAAGPGRAVLLVLDARSRTRSHDAPSHGCVSWCAVPWCAWSMDASCCAAVWTRRHAPSGRRTRPMVRRPMVPWCHGAPSCTRTRRRASSGRMVPWCAAVRRLMVHRSRTRRLLQDAPHGTRRITARVLDAPIRVVLRRDTHDAPSHGAPWSRTRRLVLDAPSGAGRSVWTRRRASSHGAPYCAAWTRRAPIQDALLVPWRAVWTRRLVQDAPCHGTPSWLQDAPSHGAMVRRAAPSGRAVRHAPGRAVVQDAPSHGAPIQDAPWCAVWTRRWSMVRLVLVLDAPRHGRAVILVQDAPPHAPGRAAWTRRIMVPWVRLASGRRTRRGPGRAVSWCVWSWTRRAPIQDAWCWSHAAPSSGRAAWCHGAPMVHGASPGRAAVRRVVLRRLVLVQDAPCTRTRRHGAMLRRDTHDAPSGPGRAVHRSRTHGPMVPWCAVSCCVVWTRRHAMHQDAPPHAGRRTHGAGPMVLRRAPSWTRTRRVMLRRVVCCAASCCVAWCCVAWCCVAWCVVMLRRAPPGAPGRMAPGRRTRRRCGYPTHMGA